MILVITSNRLKTHFQLPHECIFYSLLVLNIAAINDNLRATVRKKSTQYHFYTFRGLKILQAG